MSILIEGMELPKEGYKVIYVHSNGSVYQPSNAENIWHKIASAVPVPPHGRLIDADALHSVLRLRGKEFSDSEYGDGVKCGLADARECIKIAPTIVPAQEGGA